MQPCSISLKNCKMEWLEFEPRLVGLSVILLGQPEEQFFFFNLNLNP